MVQFRKPKTNGSFPSVQLPTIFPEALETRAHSGEVNNSTPVIVVLAGTLRVLPSDIAEPQSDVRGKMEAAKGRAG